MAGSPRGASCLPCTAEGLEGSVWKFVGGVLVREWGGGGMVFLRSLPGLLPWQQLCKIASSALVVTVGFFSLSLRCFPSCSAWRGTSGTAETRPHQNTKQWAVSTLLCPLLSLFFFPLPVFLFSSPLFPVLPPVPPSITVGSRECGVRSPGSG